MAEQIIQQPDGQLAVWSTVVDDWIIFDASPDELLDRAADLAATHARDQLRPIITQVLEGGQRPYYQFTLSFADAQALRARQHGSAPWPPQEGVG